MDGLSLLKQVQTEYLAVLGDTLVGFYVHGSAAFGCFSWERSDLDFLAVVNREPTEDQKQALISVLLSLDSAVPPKGFEMSVVTQDAVKPFLYPTPYVLHYSNAWRERYRHDLAGTCRRLNGTDPDLAAHITVIFAAGIVLYGKPIDEVFAPVPHTAYLDSIRGDIENAREDIDKNPVYILLNLCRVLAYIRNRQILSKEGGGLWGAEHLPAGFRPLISEALSYYRGNNGFTYDAASAHRFADYMLNRIAEESETNT